MPEVTTTVQPKRTPRFDWDEARDLARGGWTTLAIANKLQVSVGAVNRVVYESQYNNKTATDNYSLGNTCAEDNCNETITNNAEWCHPHATQRFSKTVRPDTLRCYTCKEWKPDDEFTNDPRRALSRRGKQGRCRACDTASRRDYRRRTRDKR